MSEDQRPQQCHLNELSKYFGHSEFRPMQWQIINSILYSKRDNCCVMATGYGKSLCYQYPPVFSGGISLVISPLISLMEDQVMALEVSNIPACFLGTAQNKKREVIENLLKGMYRLVYLTPEYVTGDCGFSLLLELKKLHSITLLAIDEAHCVSQWGHDFRPAYRDLGKIRDVLTDVPILAVTATATDTVLKDIVKSLKLRNPQILSTSFDRPNLYFSVMNKTKHCWSDISQVLRNENRIFNIENGSMIIYCLTKKSTEAVVEILQSNGIKCAGYHAGMGLKERKSVHEMFVKDEIKIIVATIAFGMGIDKPNVRCIIHYGVSSTMEAYYQEVGRAGRDGLPSLCVVFHCPADFNVHRILNQRTHQSGSMQIHKEGLTNVMKQYVSTRECRRHFIISYFEKNPTVNNSNPNCCDNCNRRMISPSDHEVYVGINLDGKYDFTEDAYKFLQVLEYLHPKTFGLTSVISILRGSKAKTMKPYWMTAPVYGIGKDKPDTWWREIAIILENHKLIQKVTKQISTNVFQVLMLVYKGIEWLRNKNNGTCRPIMHKPSADIVQCLETKIKTNPRTNAGVNGPNENQFGGTKVISPLFGNTLSSGSNIIVTAGPSNQNVPSATQAQFYNALDYIDLNNEGEALLKELLFIRHTLAQSQNINPHTIASDVALRQFCLKLPTTIEKLKEGKFDGMSDVKVEKFGAHFVDAIKKAILENANLVSSIGELLNTYPMEKDQNVRKIETFMDSVNKFLQGMRIDEIASDKKLVKSTIVDHLTSGMYYGYYIDLTQVPICPVRLTNIITVLKTTNAKLSLTEIKNACPEDYTFEEIKFAVCYCKIREHLAKLNIPYEDEFALCDGKFVSKIVNMSDDFISLDLSKFAMKPKNVLRNENTEQDSKKSLPLESTEVDSGIDVVHIAKRISDNLKSIIENVQPIDENMNDKGCFKSDIESESSLNVIISPKPVNNIEPLFQYKKDSSICEESFEKKDAEKSESKHVVNRSNSVETLLYSMDDDDDDILMTASAQYESDLKDRSVESSQEIVDTTSDAFDEFKDLKSQDVNEKNSGCIEWEDDDTIILQNLDKLDKDIDKVYDMDVENINKEKEEDSSEKDCDDSVILIEPSSSKKDVVIDLDSEKSPDSLSSFGKSNVSPKLTSSAKKRMYIDDDDAENASQSVQRILPSWILNASKNKCETKNKNKKKSKFIF